MADKDGFIGRTHTSVKNPPLHTDLYNNGVKVDHANLNNSLGAMEIGVEGAVAKAQLTNQNLISGDLWNRLVSRIVADESLTQELAERIMDQALGYLKLASLSGGTSFTPSSLVDIGWHTFILYTREYASFCMQLTKGSFIHHCPADDPKQNSISGGPTETVAAMKAHGIRVDEPLWACVNDQDCNNCNGGQGCQCGSCNY